MFDPLSLDKPVSSLVAPAGAAPRNGARALAAVRTALAVLGAAGALSLSACKSGEAPKTEPAAPSAAPVAKASAAPANQGIPAPPDVAAAPADAEATSSGLKSKVLTKGTGEKHPAATDTVEVHYTGWNKDGTMFDSSVKRGQPSKFPLNRVIKGWTEGVQLMVEGEKRRFWIPADLAYGNRPSRPGGPSGDLTFDVELIKIIEAPKPPPVPEDVKAAPATAKATKSGLKYRVLQAGTGKKHPTKDSRVTVHYSGWTTDGKMFDSSVTRGQPAQFGLSGVIKGWTEGVQLMVEGEKTRFWIPADLAYGEDPGGGRPGGLLVFDIELVKIDG